MQIRESRAAAGALAGDLGITDDGELDTLRADELFAAWAFIWEEASIYAGEVKRTTAGFDMKSAATGAEACARFVATVRAEELLGRDLGASYPVDVGLEGQR